DDSARADHQAPRLRRGGAAGDARARQGGARARGVLRGGAGGGQPGPGRAPPRGARRSPRRPAGARAVSAWEALAALPLRIEGYALEGLETQPRPEFVRKTTVIRLRGRGEEGLGEDVTYDRDHPRHRGHRGAAV